MIRVTVMAIALLIAGGAVAEDTLPNTKDARKMLFGTRGSEGAVSADVSAEDGALLEKVAITQKYYGAIAFSPDEGLLSEATVAAANYHSTAPARKAALAECNAKRASGSAKCVIGADIIPRKYKEGRDLQLSIDATFAFTKEFRKMKGDKAFATSASTGAWGVGVDGASATAACAGDGADDCAIVVEN